MALVGQAVSEKKIFEIVDGRTTDGRTPDHGHPISSPCEPNGSGELKISKLHVHVCYITKILCILHGLVIFVMVYPGIRNKNSTRHHRNTPVHPSYNILKWGIRRYTLHNVIMMSIFNPSPKTYPRYRSSYTLRPWGPLLFTRGWKAVVVGDVTGVACRGFPFPSFTWLSGCV